MSVVTRIAACLAVALLCACAGPRGPGGSSGPGKSETPGGPEAAMPESKGVGLTIYSQADPLGFDPQAFIQGQGQGGQGGAYGVPGFGVVRDTRTLDLEQGMNTVSFTDVASYIDPTTVSLADLSVAPEKAGADAVKVVEQEFQFDLASPYKILDKYLGQTITANVPSGTGGKREPVTGKLLSDNNGLVLQTDAGVRLLIDNSGSNDVQLGKLPKGLIVKPTLVWQLYAPEAGQRTVRTAYQTDGITWRADYNLLLSPDETTGDLGAWVSILNLSGTRYAGASLKLIAGDVQRIKPNGGGNSGMGTSGTVGTGRFGGGEPKTFQEKPFFEYHLYTLPRKTTIEDNSTMQLALFPTARGFALDKVLVYYGQRDMQYRVQPEPQTDERIDQEANKKVDVYVRFPNTEANHLGMPLPKGKVRVYKADTGGDNAPEFLGEALIDHTARNETVLARIGQAFDVTGDRVQTNYNIEVGSRWVEDTIKITVHNAKKTPQKVIVRENLFRWFNWELTKKSMDYEKIDSRTIHFNIEVPAEGEKTIEYTVKYSW